MAKFTFRFDEVAMNQVWFDADNEEQAKALMQQVMDEEINVSDLPNAEERNRGIALSFDCSVLESS
jgi:hypothetical protein